MFAVHDNACSLAFANQSNAMTDLLYEVKTHSLRVADLCGVFAELLGWPPEDRERAQWAGYYHDLGKHFVPAEIMLKKAALTHYERDMIQTHPEEGYLRYIQMNGNKEGNPDLLICRAILEHHERIDGNGYPKKLRGDEISELASLVSLADVVDALSSDRIYRKAMVYDQTVEVVQKDRGKVWPTYIADLFLNNLNLFQNIIYA